MKKYLIIVTVVALAVLSACSGENSQEQKKYHDNAEQLPIKLGSSLGDETRSNNATNLINGDTVWVWTDMINALDHIKEFRI